MEAFKDHLQRCIGVRFIPLSYVIRSDVAVPAACPALAVDQPYCEDSSIELDLINRASHSHGLFRDDNAEVYYKLEEATRSTVYADTIKPYQRSKNGREAFLSLKQQYAGDDKWELLLKKQDTLLHTRKWTGQSNFTLERFCQQHRNAYVTMQSCAQHVQFQLPNEHTRVGFLLDAIENNDAPLQAVMANIADDTGATGKRNNFEDAVSYLLPKDPVARKRTTQTKRTVAQISDTTAEIAGFGDKPGIGKSGVHLRWHKFKEYKALSQEQREELDTWREKKKAKKKAKNGDGNSNDGGNSKRSRNKAMAAAIEKKVNEQIEAKLKEVEAEKSSEEKDRAYLMSLLNIGPNESKPVKATTSSTSATAKGHNVTLQSILKRARN